MKRYFFITFLFLLLINLVTLAQKIYLFYPSPIQRPYSIQQKLTQLKPNYKIIVFGNYADFIESSIDDAPDAIITKPNLLKIFKGYTKVLSGLKNGKETEPYVLLSINKKIDISQNSTKTVGVLNFLNRKDMDTLFIRYFKALPKIKRVMKVEDLLPLLTFRMVNAILISQNQVDYFKEKSNMNFIVSELPGFRIGIVMLAVKKSENSPQIINWVVDFDKDLLSTFGVDKWKIK